MRIPIGAYGDCEALESQCPFTSTCACHMSAGDFRMEGGFTPFVIKDNCLTAEATPYDDGYHVQPEDTIVGFGFVSLS